MNFTFGIITNDKCQNNINTIIASIRNLNIPNYEIIVVGGSNIDNIIYIPFDESIKHNWITKKKNIICEIAKYDNIVLIHDYVELCDDWYIGFLKFGDDFDICNSKVLNNNGIRFRDYTIYPYNNCPFSSRALLPYNYPPSYKLSKISYISGAYYIIKKQIALKYPLDERLCWADGEDVVLTKQLVNNNIILKCNPHSTVKFLKQQTTCSWENEVLQDELVMFENMSDLDIEKMHQAQINSLKAYVLQRTSINLDI